ncbi:MAG: twin-arginine translocase TatA/TatE family subunit [Magnetococcales bacterium]|nr:twin-arginine translocase TatA/TatE family subunit [Magnetococcales bacterium]
MFGISMPELLIILLIVLIFFGAGKLPNVMSDLGKAVRSFKRSVDGDEPPVEATKQGGVIEGPAIKKEGSPTA